ncbi:ABC transporter ATP-binding protein, partial [Streptomyces muensis]
AGATGTAPAEPGPAVAHPAATPHRAEAADGVEPPQGPPAPDDERRTGGAGGTPDAAEGRVPTHEPAHEATTLTTHHLQAHYNGFTALNDVTVTVPPGRVTAIVGPNGAGKSTLFHCLAGTHHPTHGRIHLGPRDITHLPAHTRTRLGIARTFQQLAVFPSLTVAENVQVGAEQGRTRDPAAAERSLRLLGLDGPVRALPAADLPTGTLRRVELARALAGDPRVLLLDEPAAGLDTAEVTALARVLKALAADGMALLVVEHDLDLVADLADTVHVMAAGRIVASGPPDRVLDAASSEETPA